MSKSWLRRIINGRRVLRALNWDLSPEEKAVARSVGSGSIATGSSVAEAARAAGQAVVEMRKERKSHE